MHNLRRFYYQNKYKIWGIIIFIVLILLVIQVVNKLVEYSNEQSLKEATANNITNNTNINNQNKDTYVSSDRSSVTGEIINDSTLEKASNAIENFISACNNGNIEQAYNLLSDDCKEELYPDINKFKILYYDSIFGGSKKTASLENWSSNTYKVNIAQDIMASGNINGMKTQDYISIVKDGKDTKLNINSFVKKEKINKTQTIENIKFTILSKNIYMDYEEFEIQVDNQTNSKISLDSKQDTKSIYIQDNNKIKYYARTNEILNSLLRVNKGFSTQLTIKFSKSYSEDRKTSNIVFSDVTLNDDNNKKVIKIKL